jgi:hypothetical protein
MTTPELYRVLQYSTEEFPFATRTAKTLETADLSKLYSYGISVRKREDDQQTEFHKKLYAGFSTWKTLYTAFIREFVGPIITEPFYVQAIPTFRISLIGNKAVGEFHTDLKYGHPEGEVNFWLPLTDARRSNSIWIEDESHKAIPINTHFGQAIMFDANRVRHGNLINDTKTTRVSFDFRVLPVRLFDPTHAGKSVNQGLKFVPGEYYLQEAIEP